MESNQEFDDKDTLRVYSNPIPIPFSWSHFFDQSISKQGNRIHQTDETGVLTHTEDKGKVDHVLNLRDSNIEESLA